MPNEKPKAVSLWIIIIFIVIVPLTGSYGAGVVLEQYWLTPVCISTCAAQGATLVGVTPGHKSGTPPAGCMCRDHRTVPWSGPTWVGFAQMVVYLGLSMGLMALVGIVSERGLPQKKRLG